MKKKYNYFYKIVNLLNGNFYYGVHSTNNLEDGYMGSGRRLKFAYKKYGIENFKKEIIKFFGSATEAYKYESEIVNESLVYDTCCYNIACGGIGWNTQGTVLVRDKNGEYLRCVRNCPKLHNGEYIPATKGFVAVEKKENGEHLMVDISKYDKGIYKALTSGQTVVRSKDGKTFRVSIDDERLKNGELVSVSKNKLTAVDKNGRYYHVSTDDKRYVSGELKFLWCGRKHKPESIQKQKETYKKTKHGKGKNNSQYGTCWIYRFDENTRQPINKKIKKEDRDKFLREGWILGRKMKI